MNLRIAENWQVQRDLIEKMYREYGVGGPLSLTTLLAKHENPGPGYGHKPADFKADRRSEPLPKAEPTKAELEAERRAQERYHAIRERLRQRFCDRPRPISRGEWLAMRGTKDFEEIP